MSRTAPPLLAIAALAMVSLAACGDPRAPHYLIVERVPADVVGRYELDDGWSVLPDGTEATVDAARASSLVLRADGTFSAASLPGREDTRSFVGPPLVDASGTWSIATIGRVERDGGSHPVWAFTFSSDPALEPASLLDAAPPHRLVVVLGDPDEGLGLALRRVD